MLDMPKVELNVRLGKVRDVSGGSTHPAFIIKCAIDASPLKSYDLSIEGMLKCKYFCEDFINFTLPTTFWC